MGNQDGRNLTLHTGSSHAVSLRARSDADLTQAIHSPGDEAFILDRARVCLKLFYDPEMDMQDRAEMLDSYARALRAWPRWAVAKAFDEWERTRNRRPSPGDLGILAANAVKELTDELARRHPKQPEAPPVERVSPEAAAAILAAAGFTPRRMEAVRQSPMALSLETAHQRAEVTRKHWSDDAAPDDPMWRELLKARERANGGRA